MAAVHDDLPHLPEIGRLLIPRLMTDIEQTAHAGIPWAADCDAFGGFGPAEEKRFLVMLDRIRELPGCLWITCPDVLGDHEATVEQFHRWAPHIPHPKAFVLQNGAISSNVPWGELACVFIGGDDQFKLGPEARALALEARERGLLVHMGRVNSHKRMRYAMSLNCDSVDGTKFARWRGEHLDDGVRWLRAARDQLRLEMT